MIKPIKYFLMIIPSLRPAFLVLTPVCIILAVGVALSSQHSVDLYKAVLVLIGALAAHMSVNTFNEYFDFASGLDALTNKTPFSGGSGLLQDKPYLASTVLTVAVLCLIVSTLIGFYFVFTVGWLLLPLGAAGLLLVVLYTPYITRSPLISLISPGLAFGPIIILGTGFVLTENYSANFAVASLIPFFLVNNLLLLNQFPDVEADRQIGRLNYPILIGKQKCGLIYSLFLIMAYLSIILGVVSGLLARNSLFGLLTLIIAVPTIIGVSKYANNLDRLMVYLKLNVVINLLTPLLVGLGLMLE